MNFLRIPFQKNSFIRVLESVTLPMTNDAGKSTGVAGRRRKISSLVANCVDDKFFQMGNQIAATNTEVNFDAEMMRSKIHFIF